MGWSKSERDDAFTRFMDEAVPSLTRTAWLLCGDRDAAQDLVQAALVKTYVAWPRVRAGEALAYTRRILINAHTDAWRRRHGEILLAEPRADGAVPGTADADRHADHDQIVRLLATLPPQQRAVIVLRYYDDLSEAETARHLGISVGAVKSAASRGLARLRTVQNDQSPEGSLR